MPVTILHASDLPDQTINKLESEFTGQIIAKPTHYRVKHAVRLSAETIKNLTDEFQIDINTVPEAFNPEDTGLLITDMDSTLISIECIDEIADFLGIKARVAEITESAMRGEIDFSTSLKKRVGLLAGLNIDALQRVYSERLTLNPGAEILMSKLKEKGIKRALVSGGFSYFTDKLKQRLALDATLSNMLEIEGDKLTGVVTGEIVDGRVKADFLRKLCSEYRVKPENCIAVGDGANDLPMMMLAGLSVAYHAKPAVQEKAKIVLNYSGLDAILDILEV